MADFRRKDDYSDKVIDRIRNINRDHKDVLFIPNKNCIKGYYKGLTLFERITDNSENLVKWCPMREWDKSQNEILNAVGKRMPRDKERKTQQIIALQNMSFEKDRYSVCGFETAISTLDVSIPGKKGAPEIDLVVLRPSDDPGKRSILFVEYKCKGSTMIKGNQNIECHYRDYMAILHSDVLDDIKSEIIKSYRLISKIRGKETEDEDFNVNDYRTQIAFLFVDRVYDEQGSVESEITDKEYETAMSMFRNMDTDLNELLYLRYRTPEEVCLDDWRTLEGSGLQLMKRDTK